jgi:broad specificity phosphatase PhoE
MCNGWGMSVTLFLFRHGRTTWNALGKYQGQTDTDLDDLGKAQALAVGMRCRDLEPAALYSSDLVRCLDVAAQIEALSGRETITDERLREVDFGAWSGHTRAEIIEKFPDEYEAWRNGDQDMRPGGGESATILRARVADFIEEVRVKHEGGLVIAVSHAAWIRSAVRWALGAHIPGIGTPTQGSLTVLTLGSELITLETFNDRGHLLNLSPADQETHAPAVY